MSKEEAQMRNRDRLLSGRESEWRMGEGDFSSDDEGHDERLDLVDTEFAVTESNFDSVPATCKKGKSISVSTLDGHDAGFSERCRAMLNHSAQQLEHLMHGESTFELELRETLRNLDVQLRVIKSRCELLDDRLNDAIEAQRRDLETLKSELRNVQEHVEDELKERASELKDMRTAASARIDKMGETVKVDRRVPAEPIRVFASKLRRRLGNGNNSMWRSLLSTRLRRVVLACCLLSLVFFVCGVRWDMLASKSESDESGECQSEAALPCASV